MPVQTLPAFTIVGISARTNNVREFAGNGVIAGMWERVTKDGLIEQIPNRLDRSVLALYTNYESDHNGEYDFVIGAKVSTGSPVPDGYVVFEVPEQQYELVSSEPGPAWQNVPKAWEQVWQTLSDKRSYVADFEVYDERCQNPETAVVDLWIGVK